MTTWIKNESSNITKELLIASAVAILLDFARDNFLGKLSLMFLIWNLFLAWIPYIISLQIKKDLPVKNFIFIFILWLLFFPNAPYLTTDVIHIASNLAFPIWYDSILFFLFGWIGLFLGIISLFHINEYIKIHIKSKVSEIIILGICLLTSFGVYLGRFERWNSWDIFINPFRLVKNSHFVSVNIIKDPTLFVFTAVFTLLLYVTYRTIRVLLQKNEN